MAKPVINQKKAGNIVNKDLIEMGSNLGVELRSDPIHTT
jgi:hypothetical protein